MPPFTEGYHATQNNVECRVKPLTVQESRSLFGVDLITKGYQPLGLEITNNSPHTYIMSWRHIGIPLTSENIIRDVSHYQTSLIAFTSSLLAAIYWWPAIPVVIVPSAIMMASYNKDIDYVLEEFGVKNTDFTTILPHECVQKVIFVYGWERSQIFDIGLLNKKTREFIKFTVTL